MPNGETKFKNVVVIGCGRMGAALAYIMSEQNKNVTVIDQDEESFQKLSPAYGGNTLLGDGSNINVLKEADIANTDILVAATNDDNVNLFISAIARQIHGVPRVFCRLYEQDKQQALKDMAIKAICPPALSVNAFREALEEKKEASVDENTH
ncbi:MAG: potassium channel family protein [Bacillota bacterium]